MSDKPAGDDVRALCEALLDKARVEMSEYARAGDWKQINYSLGWQDALLAVRQILQDFGA